MRPRSGNESVSVSRRISDPLLHYKLPPDRWYQTASRLCFTTSGTSVGRLKGWNHLKTWLQLEGPLPRVLVGGQVGAGRWWEASVPLRRLLEGSCHMAACFSQRERSER